MRVELARIALEEASAPMDEEIGISLREHARIGRGRRAAEMDRSGECLRQMRFDRKRSVRSACR